MKNNPEWLYLMSSNASKKYIMDVLETLSLPYGSIQHFRYQLKWIDNDLKNKLPMKVEGINSKNELRDIKVVMCYLYQEKKGEHWQWRTSGHTHGFPSKS